MDGGSGQDNVICCGSVEKNPDSTEIRHNDNVPGAMEQQFGELNKYVSSDVKTKRVNLEHVASVLPEANGNKDVPNENISATVAHSHNEHAEDVIVKAAESTKSSGNRKKKRKKRRERRAGEQECHAQRDSDTNFARAERTLACTKDRNSIDNTTGKERLSQTSYSENLKLLSANRLWLGAKQEKDKQHTVPTISGIEKEDPRSEYSEQYYNMFTAKYYITNLPVTSPDERQKLSENSKPGANNKKSDKRKKNRTLNLKRTSAKVSVLPSSLPAITSRIEIDPTARTPRKPEPLASPGDSFSPESEESVKFPEPCRMCKLMTSYPLIYFFSFTFLHVAIFAVTAGLLFNGYDVFPAVFDEFPLYIYNNVRLQELSWRSRNAYPGSIFRPVYGFNINTGYRGTIKDTAEVIYEKPGVNILTAQHLEWIQTAENRIFKEKIYQTYFCLLDYTYTCWKPQSLLRLFDGTYSHVDAVFKDPTFSNVTEVIYKASIYNETKAYLQLFLGKDSVITPKGSYTTITRSFFFMGWPLWAMQNGRLGTQVDIENYLADIFKPEVENIRDFFLVERLDVYYISKLLYEHDLVEQALTDIQLAIGSFLFIFVFMCFQTGSVVVTFLGILSILSSFLLTNLFYRYVFQFRYFGFFHVIAIFLILGIGADDLFVFYDTWRLTGHTKYPSDTYRLSDCYRRAAKSTFVTSLTTAIAFLVSGLSPLLPVKTFGIFAGILVALNYLWVVVYFPSIVIIHHTITKKWWIKIKRFLLYLWLGVRVSNYNGVERSSAVSNDSISVSETNSAEELLPPSSDQRGSVPANGHAAGVGSPRIAVTQTSPINCNHILAERQSELSINIEEGVTCGDTKIDTRIELNLAKIESQNDRAEIIKRKLMKPRKNFEERNAVVKFLRNSFYDFMTKRIVKILVPLLFLGISIFFIHRATLLEPDTIQLRLFRNNHNYAKATERHYFSFLRNQDEEYQRLYLVWGMLPADISMCNQKSADFCFGKPQYDANFDMNSAAAQLAFKDLCERLEHIDSQMINRLHIQRDTVTKKPKIACFTKDFETYFQNEIASNWLLPADMVISLPVSPGNVTKLMSSDSIVYRKPLPPDFNNFFEVLVSYWLTDGYQLNPTKDYFTYNGLLAEKKIDGVTLPAYGIDYGLYYGTKLHYLAIEVNTTMNLYNLGYQEGLPIFNDWENFIHNINEGMPAPLQNGIQVTENLWHWLHVQETLASSAIMGIMIGLFSAWPILILTTMNVVIGTIAVVTIGLVTACVVGIIPLAGWKLGVLESINLCMVVGLSVDYIVHLAEAYQLSKSTQRLGRVHDMLESIGLSVISGAVTTMGAAAFMLFAKIHFFFQFGIFILSAVGISLLFSLLGFTTILSLIGPQNNTGSLPHMLKGLVKFCKRTRNPESEQHNSSGSCPCAPPSVLVDRFFDWLSYHNDKGSAQSSRQTKPVRAR